MKKLTFFSVTLSCLLQIANTQLVPSYRKLHNAVLVENKLYIFGGVMDSNSENKSPDNNFFYLDMSISFDTSQLPWKTIPNNAENLPMGSFSPVSVGGTAAGIGGINNDTIFFINSENDLKVPPVHSFNAQKNLWETPNISGTTPIGRNQMRVITDHNSKIYLLSGKNSVKGMFILDTINFNCKIETNSLISRLSYGATLLPNGVIVYMGGSDDVNIQNDFKVVYLYDTNNDKWEAKATTGNTPPNDFGITSVLGLDGNRIIVFGGIINNILHVLDLTSYEWYTPKTKGKGPVFKRGEHTANVIGKYMVIIFGKHLSLW